MKNIFLAIIFALFSVNLNADSHIDLANQSTDSITNQKESNLKNSRKLTNDLLQTILSNLINASKQTQNNYLLKIPHYKAQSDKKFNRLIKAIEILQSDDKKQAKILKYKILECPIYKIPCTKESQLDIGEPFELEQFELFYSAIDWSAVALANLTLGEDKKKERNFRNAFEYIEGQISLELHNESIGALLLSIYLYIVVLWDLSSNESSDDSKPKNAILTRGIKDGKVVFAKYSKMLSANDYKFLEGYFK